MGDYIDYARVEDVSGSCAAVTPGIDHALLLEKCFDGPVCDGGRP